MVRMVNVYMVRMDDGSMDDGSMDDGSMEATDTWQQRFTETNKE
jgi:hypothetical protein